MIEPQATAAIANSVANSARREEVGLAAGWGDSLGITAAVDF
jgi:hypothetical protein